MRPSHRFASASATARPGNTCPAVPPPVNATHRAAAIVRALAIRYVYLTMRALLPAICLLLAATYPAPAADLGRLLGGDVAAALAADGSLRRVVERGAMPGWLPAVDSREGILADVRRLDPTIVVELLRWYPDLPARYDTSDGRLRLFNAVRAVSTMQGLTYWSASRGKERVLFTLSHAVAGPSDPSPLPDPVALELPSADRLYSLQVDQTFGRHFFLGTYENRADHLIVTDRERGRHLVPPPPRDEARGHGDRDACSSPFPTASSSRGSCARRSTMPVVDRAGREASLLNRLVALSNWVGSRLGTP